jgi:hypothetical protein
VLGAIDFAQNLNLTLTEASGLIGQAGATTGANRNFSSWQPATTTKCNGVDQFVHQPGERTASRGFGVESHIPSG